VLGAVIGDIAGSRFERNSLKSKDFVLFTPQCSITDDSVMTLAVAEAVLRSSQEKEKLGRETVRAMQAFGRRWAKGCYGARFAHWLASSEPEPYGSFGNGAAMRVSPCAWAAVSFEDALEMARRVTEVTHNHPEGLKGAAAVTGVIWLARHGASLAEIRASVTTTWYPLDFTLDEIRTGYDFDASCQGSVPQAIEAFLESKGFEDAVRNAVSLGGDSDTIAAMTGSMAEAFYGIPEAMRIQALEFLDDPLRDVIARFERAFPHA